LLLASLVYGYGEGGYQTARVEGEEVGVFLVWVDLEVLMWDAFFVEGDPAALDEGTEPAAVEDQRVRLGVGGGEVGGSA
jgi:hypothetical protein